MYQTTVLPCNSQPPINEKAQEITALPLNWTFDVEGWEEKVARLHHNEKNSLMDIEMTINRRLTQFDREEHIYDVPTEYIKCAHDGNCV